MKPKKQKNVRKTETKNASAVSRERKYGALRCIILALCFLCAVGFYIFRLSELSLRGDDGVLTADDGTRIYVSTRTVTVKAVRGEIRDCNGKTLAANRLFYRLSLNADTFPSDDTEANQMLATLLSYLDQTDTDSVRESSLPVLCGYADGRYVYYYKSAEDTTETARQRFSSYLETVGLPVSVDTTTLLGTMFDRYHLTDENGAFADGMDSYTAFRIAAIRYDLEMLTFDSGTPYVLCTDTPLSLITPILENRLSGLSLTVEAKRVYPYAGYASHILGHTGKIQQSKVAYYTEHGYPLDAVVGIDGIEAVYEEMLCGTDGEMVIEEDQYGNILSETVTKEAVAGKNVYLTIDIDLQMAAEDALADNIRFIVENALAKGETLSGEDANAGAIVVINPETGAILASASYPTYDLNTYSADYAALAADETLPLFNRVLLGTYAPGSTFKVGVAAAALEAGILTPETTIDTKGVYDYYEDYQPRCWLYTKTGQSHGAINVIEALKESCNYFFFETGRQLGINKLAGFMSSLGLGQETGVELPESAGILSSPAYTDSQNIPWTGAATLQTAIGQGYNAVTPMQLAVYLSTMINGGTRYQPHYFRGCADAGSTVIPEEEEPIVRSTVSLSETTIATVIEAMRQVASDGSAKRIFADYPVSVGAKTGTAEGDAAMSANAVFAAFLPADPYPVTETAETGNTGDGAETADTASGAETVSTYRAPEILAVSVIENGASGTNAGFCVKDVFDYYLANK